MKPIICKISNNNIFSTSLILPIQQAKVAILIKFIKFSIIGLAGLVADFATTWILKEKLRCPKLCANSVGFVLAASINYILNRRYTFASTNPAIVLEYTKFITVAFIGLGINTTIIWLLLRRTEMNFYVCKLIAIVCTTLWNFGANLVYTF